MTIKEDTVLVLSHFGLGDHLVINGLVRQLVKRYSSCTLLVRKNYLATLAQLYFDSDKVFLVGVLPSLEVQIGKFVSENFKDDRVEVIGLGYFGRDYLVEPDAKFDRDFYLQAGVDFSSRWNDFYYERNLGKEMELFEVLGCPAGPYVFLHEDKTRNFLVDRSLIPPEYKVVSSNEFLNFSLLDYRMVIEKAVEVHCIESSFSAFIEVCDKKDGLFAHRYARPEAQSNSKLQYTYRLPWQVFD